MGRGRLPTLADLRARATQVMSARDSAAEAKKAEVSAADEDDESDPEVVKRPALPQSSRAKAALSQRSDKDAKRRSRKQRARGGL